MSLLSTLAPPTPTLSPAETPPPTLLAIDDDPCVLDLVDRLGRKFGFDVVKRTDAQAALREFPSLNPQVVLVDLRMPLMNGLDVLRNIREQDPACQVILMTGYECVDTAMEAVRLGALDYIAKPFDRERVEGLLLGVRKNLERRALMVQADADLATRFAFYGMIGRSPAMQELFDKIRRLAPHVRSALLVGETGTGKELVARALHNVGPRRTRRFVTVNCSAVVETLFESELFGHQRGAFTGASEAKVGLFEHADRGTLFLDEIGELPLSIQPKLLRAVEYGEVQRVGSLESKQVNVTIVAATNRDLRREADSGRFRSDLYHRLGILELRIPPLRERREDIPLLVGAFVKQVCERLQRPVLGVSAAAEGLLQQASWTGNVRELRNVVERACLLSDGRMIVERDIVSSMPSASSPSPARSWSRPMGPMAPRAPLDPGFLDRARIEQLEEALRETGGNKAAAARLLGISRRSMYRWIDRLEYDSASQPPSSVN